MNEECKWICDAYVKKLFTKLYFPSNNDKINEINKYHSNCVIHNNRFSFLKPENDETDDIVRTRKYKLQINFKQKQIIFKWMKSCRNVYNTCVNKKSTNTNYKKLKLEIFNDIYGKNKKNCPYDILTDEVRSYCSNLKSAISNKKSGNIKSFQLKPRSFFRGQSILIPKKSLQTSGFFKTKLGEIKNFGKYINIKNITCDCRLLYDKFFDKFYLYVPEHKKPNKVKNIHRKNVVALDPGEKTFISYYSHNNYGKIGDDIRKPILKIEKKIRKCQRILSKKNNKFNKKLKNKKAIVTKKRKCYRKINNIVKELHNKTSLYLCRNYKKILIPDFKTQKMVTNKTEMKKKIKENILKIKNNKVEMRKYSRKCRLSGRVKFVLNMLSFYKFKQHLLNKSQEYGCKVEVVTEEYTSRCCGKCGKLSSKYDGREKECEYCGVRINRDINGARNILIKNYDKWLKLRS